MFVSTSISPWTWIGPGSYMLGSIPFGLILGKVLGRRDVRAAGSGNIGAANVARVAGAGAGVLTLLLDAAKGAFPVWLAGRASGENAAMMMAAALAAIAGHCFPIWLKFRGGKGVATAAGAFLVLCPAAMGCAALLYILVVFLWRIVSLASLAAAAAMPLLVYFLWAPHRAPPILVSLGTLFAAVLIFAKHHGNLRRLWRGEEPRFAFGRKDRGGE
jgi:acyl phosphate:glycerol-3-phosphate acyltransferase